MDILRTPDDLRRLRKRGLGVIQLAFEHAKREEWEADLNIHYHACGCDTGERAMLIGLALGAATLIVRYVDEKLVASCIVVALAVSFGGVGKGFGIVRARRKLARTIREIEQAWRR